jgi:hypothetical protein
VGIPSCILKSITSDPLAIETDGLDKTGIHRTIIGSSQTTCTAHLRYPIMHRGNKLYSALRVLCGAK